MNLPNITLFVRQTVRGRMIVMLLLSCLVPLSLLGGVSYYSLTSILQNKINKGFAENVDKERLSLENTLSNLNITSQEIGLDVRMQTLLETLATSSDPFVRSESLNEIISTVRLINFINPSTGLIMLVRKDTGEVLYASLPPDGKQTLSQLPNLSSVRGFAYQAPHPSIVNYHSSGQLSLSILRETETSETKIPFQIYIETNDAVFSRLFGGGQNGEKVTHLLIDANQKVVFSEDPTQFPVGMTVPTNPTESGHLSLHKHLLFTSPSTGHWSMIIAVKTSDYRQELVNWLRIFSLVALLSLAISLGIAGLVWRTVYRPLRLLRMEINEMTNNRLDTPKKFLNLLEFDELLYRFYRMKQRIGELLQEVQEKEKHKRMVEVEKLMYQINPHFIHNTLSTVQLLAGMSGQNELVRLVAYFTRILHYNLGKEGIHVTVTDEINNLKDYVAMQQIRYNSPFQVQFEIDPEAEHCRIPRFLLQPLVENAMYHGFRNKDGTIRVEVKQSEPGWLHVEVRDNGDGISAEELERLIEGEKSPVRGGLGIGLKFVRNILNAEFGEACVLHVESTLGEGTAMWFAIPMTYNLGGEADDPNDPRG